MDYHSPVSIVNFRSPTSPIMYKLTFCTLLFKKAGNFVVTHQPVQRQVHLFLFFITRVSETSPRLIPWIHAVPQSHMHRVTALGVATKGFVLIGSRTLNLHFLRCILQLILPPDYSLGVKASANITWK